MKSDKVQHLVEQFWTDKARGLLLGQAYADAFAAHLGGRPLVEKSAIARRENVTRSIPHTASTELMLAVTEYLATHGTIGDDDTGSVQTYLAHTWWASRRRTGFGSDDTRLFQAILRGRARPPSASPRRGIAPAALVAPFALASLGGSEPARSGHRFASLLSYDPADHTAAAAFATAVALSTASDRVHPLRDHTLPDQIEELAGRERRITATALWQLTRRPTGPASEARVLLADEHGSLGPVAAAVLAFLRFSDRPQDALCYAVRIGGPATAIAPMTGALIGARHGHSGLPPDWHTQLDSADRVDAAAVRLAAKHTVVLTKS